MAGLCGNCTACCNVFNIPAIGHVGGSWCKHCDIGGGCKIYTARPEACSSFECMWLNSWTDPNGCQLPVEMRPDRTRVIFSPTTHPNIIMAITMPNSPDAWKKQPANGMIATLVKAGVKVVIGAPNTRKKLLLDKTGMRQILMTEPDENGIQWNLT